jgi:flagellar FliL protein
MSDSDDIDLGEGESSGGGGAKKASGIAALLPNLLKFVAIGLGALIFIVTVSAITYNILNKGGQSQTIIPSNSPFVGARPQYQFFSSIGLIRTNTKDPLPYSVIVDMIIGYDLNDNSAQAELTGRLYELRDFVRVFFKTKMVDELGPENEPRLKQEILEMLNTRVLNSARARIILFNQLDVISME